MKTDPRYAALAAGLAAFGLGLIWFVSSRDVSGDVLSWSIIFTVFALPLLAVSVPAFVVISVGALWLPMTWAQKVFQRSGGLRLFLYPAFVGALGAVGLIAACAIGALNPLGAVFFWDALLHLFTGASGQGAEHAQSLRTLVFASSILTGLVLALAELARDPGGFSIDLRAAGRAVLDRHPLIGAALSPMRRANRRTFVTGVAIVALGAWYGGALLSMAAAAMGGFSGTLSAVRFGVQSLVWALCGWAVFTLTVNRLHDLGRSGVWAVAPGIAAVLIVVIEGSTVASGKAAAGVISMSMLFYFVFALALSLLSGAPSPNKYGPVPPASRTQDRTVQV